MLNNIPENIKFTISSSLPLVISLLLFLLVGNFGISKLRDIRGRVDAATKEKNTLTQKLNILETVGPTLAGASDAATIALPGGNSALLTISQLRNLAYTHSLMLTNLKSGAEIVDASGLYRVDVTFEIVGNRPAIITFLENIGAFAPISVVDSIRLNESAGMTHGNVSVKSFWSPFPSKLPALTQAIVNLTPDEQSVLSSVTSLKQPLFLTLPPATSAGKTDPFSL